MSKVNNSYFDGGLFSYIIYNIFAFLLTVCTLGFCYPWAMCIRYRWKINHTVIQGYRLEFHGSAIGLVGNWIKWWFLTLITLGIYGFWVFIKLEEWKVKNTVLVEN